MEKLLDKLEVIWESHSILISVFFSLLTAFLYLFNLIDGIRDTVSNVITFSSIVIGVNGVFLTLLITLQESPAFSRLKHLMPSFQTRLYIGLRKLIHHGLIVVTLSIIISLLPPSPGRVYSAIGVAIWSYFFWSMTIGSFHSVKLVTDIIVKNFDIPTRKIQK